MDGRFPIRPSVLGGMNPRKIETLHPWTSQEAIAMSRDLPQTDDGSTDCLFLIDSAYLHPSPSSSPEGRPSFLSLSQLEHSLLELLLAHPPSHPPQQGIPQPSRRIRLGFLDSRATSASSASLQETNPVTGNPHFLNHLRKQLREHLSDRSQPLETGQRRLDSSKSFLPRQISSPGRLSNDQIPSLPPLQKTRTLPTAGDVSSGS